MNNKKMILANIGSGSSYLPDIAEMLIERRDTMQVAEWRLMDIDDYRLNCTGKYVKKMFEEKIDEELLNFINSKLELYNKLTEDRANVMFKNIFFNELYDRRVRGMI